MRATEFLNNMRELNALINATQEALDRLNSLGGFGVGNSSSVKTNKEAEKNVKRYELREKLLSYIDDLLIYHEAAVNMIREGNIRQTSKVIILQRYILGKAWCEVAKVMDMTETSVRRLNGTVIADVATNAKFWINLPKI